jgi:hypothetical protein
MPITMVTVLIISLFIAIIVIMFFGNMHWQNDTQILRQQLTRENGSIQPCTYEPKELENLPARFNVTLRLCSPLGNRCLWEWKPPIRDSSA